MWVIFLGNFSSVVAMSGATSYLKWSLASCGGGEISSDADTQTSETDAGISTASTVERSTVLQRQMKSRLKSFVTSVSTASFVCNNRRFLSLSAVKFLCP